MNKATAYKAARRSLYWARHFRASGDTEYVALAMDSFRRNLDSARSADR